MFFMNRTILWSFTLVFIIGCERAPKPSLPDEYAKERASYYKQTASLKGKFGIVLFNLDMSNINEGFIPKTPILRNDPKSRWSHNPIVPVAAKFTPAFFDNLPEDIRKELDKLGIPRTQVDIFWVAQASFNLGEGEDYPPDFLDKTTRFKPHAWADPDAPSEYKGDRVKRNFLFGVFDSDRDISTEELPMGRMVETPVHTHDGTMSPRSSSSMLKVSSQDPSQAFWTLVVDDKNPDGKIRAAATLFWILKMADNDALRNMVKSRYKDMLKTETFGQLLGELRSSEEFANTSMLRKLESLFKNTP